MGRDFQINGESMVYVRSRSDSAIGSLQQLGLAADPIRWTPTFLHHDLNVDATGEAVVDVQNMTAFVTIRMTLIHFDPVILDECVRLSMAASAVGFAGRAGQRLGNNFPQFAAGNNLIGVGIASPIAGKPWRFHSCHLIGPGMDYPLGTKKTMADLIWRGICYTTDPWGGGTGSLNIPIWDNQALTGWGSV